MELEELVDKIKKIEIRQDTLQKVIDSNQRCVMQIGDDFMELRREWIAIVSSVKRMIESLEELKKSTDKLQSKIEEYRE